MTGNDGRCIVTVAATSLRSDSRTLKQAYSMHRLGYRSAVACFGGGTEAPDLKLIPLGAPEPPRIDAGPTSGTAAPPRRSFTGVLRERWRRLYANQQPLPLELFAFLAWSVKLFAVSLARVAPRLPRADLYYLHSYSLFPAVWLRARMCGAAIVYDAHDFYSYMTVAGEQSRLTRRWVAPFQRAMERWCVRRADAVVTVCNGLAELFEARFGKRA